MKNRILAILAVGLLAGPMAAHAYIVEISGTTSSDGQWNITTVTGLYSNFRTTLASQEWWGNSPLAGSFASALGTALGYPNTFVGGDGSVTLLSPLFVYTEQAVPLAFEARTCLNTADCSVTAGILLTGQTGTEWTFAVAERIAVPEPATLSLFGLGLAGLAFARQRKQK